jgi:NADH-quinone oxidoreductase subunit A
LPLQTGIVLQIANRSQLPGKSCFPAANLCLNRVARGAALLYCPRVIFQRYGLAEALDFASAQPAALAVLRTFTRKGLRRMEQFLLEYLPVLLFIGIAIGLGLVLTILPFVLAPQKPDPEKLSAYECGFNAFGDARMKFDVRFYLVSILFIIFDLEVAFLFPWAVTLGDTGVFAFWSMMVFLGVLTVGFIYEWKKGALEWE